MDPEEIRRLLRARPFVPFLIFMRDGRAFDISDHVHAGLSPDGAVFGLSTSRVPWMFLDPREFVRVEPLPDSVAHAR